MSEGDQDQGSVVPSGPWARPPEDSSSSLGTSRRSLTGASLSDGSSVASGGPWAVYDRGPSAAALSTIQLVEDGLRRRPPSYMLGSPARRAVAKLIDRTLLGLALVPAVVVGLLVGPGLACLLTALVLGLLALGFEWYLTATRGHSPGMYLLGLRIISAEGGKVGFRQAVVLRSWAMLVAALAGVPLLVDLYMLHGPERRALRDRLAKTRVILAGSLGDPYASL